MNLTALFINRPVATILLSLAITLSGALAFSLLPVAPLPQVDFPTIAVSASLPGASPDTMAATVATPLERSLGRIAGMTEMTSSSSLGNTRIILQFDLNRDINGAARDVQAAINASRSLLPSGLPSNPTYRKINPADAPVLLIALTSKTKTRGQMYDAASTILAQKLSQVDGVGQVSVGGASLPAVRVELNPNALNKYGVSLEQVRTAISATNANRPKGFVEDATHHWQIYANDQATTAQEYLPLIVAYNNSSPIRLSDVGEVVDSVQDVRNTGLANGVPAVVVMITRQPGANIVETVDRIKAVLPEMRHAMPPDIDLQVVFDRTPSIRSSLHEVERSLMMSTALVILVVFLFLRRWSATLIPAVAVPISLIGTFGVMYLCGFSLDTLSMMALTVATGFVVDDAIVVLENVTRHIEQGMPARKAAFVGAREVAFTVCSMSISLIAVFIPILLMGGVVGRIFQEFALTLSAAILVSLAVSLSTTPMMCARLLGKPLREPGRLLRAVESVITGAQRGYGRTLAWALRHRALMMLLLLLTVCLNFYLYVVIPKGFIPQQDVGRVMGNIQADQSISFQAMQQKLKDFMAIVIADPAVETVVGSTGGGGGPGGSRNTASLNIALKPAAQRKESTDQVIARIRKATARESGARLYLQGQQDVRVGGRPANAEYQYTLQADNLEELRSWEPKIRAALNDLPELEDVNTDQQDKGIQVTLNIDRATASKLGVTPQAIDSTLNDAFGQRQVSTIYAPLNQYHVVMEVAPQYWQSPQALAGVYVSSQSGSLVPLSAFAHYEYTNTPLAVNHQGQFVATTISFNLNENTSLSNATRAIDRAFTRIGVPPSIHGSFQGTAKAFQDATSNQPIVILTALLTIYIVLGILYESYVHPITILSTLPSAGVGALLALLICNIEFSLIALIGVFLLIGIVKKNAIMMIDFALVAERERHLNSRDAIFEACMLRFRPIMMTTMAALLGAVPLAIGFGEGGELRRPLGISIVGGLIVSQLLTLYTTPVVYLYLDRFRLWSGRKFGALFGGVWARAG